MSTRPRRTPRPGHDSAPDTLSVAASPGPVVGSVCTGYGGLDLGMLAALGGGRVAWCADPDPHIAQVLAERVPGVPNLGDVRAIDWTQVEPVEVLTPGFPCQDISAAGRHVGIEKRVRSGLWTDIVAGVRVLRPALVVVENVAALRWRNGGLHCVLGDLAEAGYDALWRSVRAADIGAAHRRARVFLLAWPVPAPPVHEPAREALPDAEMLPTPTAHDGSSNGISAASRQGGPSLLDQLRLLPTPTASDAKNCTHRTQRGGPSLPDQARLVQARLLPTPTAADSRSAAIQTVFQPGRGTPVGCVTLTDSVRERQCRWPNTGNPHLLLTERTAHDHRPVSNYWLRSHTRELDLTLNQLRIDRQLEEALVHGPDPLHLAAVFGIAESTAIRYARAAEQLLASQIEVDQPPAR